MTYIVSGGALNSTHSLPTPFAFSHLFLFNYDHSGVRCEMQQGNCKQMVA